MKKDILPSSWEKALPFETLKGIRPESCCLVADGDNINLLDVNGDVLAIIPPRGRAKFFQRMIAEVMAVSWEHSSEFSVDFSYGFKKFLRLYWDGGPCGSRWNSEKN